MENSLNQSTYERFKKDILTFSLKPGDTVSAAKIADRYSVSRTPAREALVRLETEGLVDIIPQSRSVISRIDINKAKQEWFIRYSLEIAMVDRIFEHKSENLIRQMKKQNKNMTQLSQKAKSHENSYAYQMADNAFHAATYIAAGEELSANVIAGTMAHYSRLRFLTEVEDTYQDRTITGHEKLIELLEADDREGYRSALKTHLGYILKDVEEMERRFPNYFVND